MFDHLSDALAAIYRCSKQKQLSTLIPNTNLVCHILSILFRLGYISGFNILHNNKIRVFIKFEENGVPVIRGLHRVSKSGGRVYISYKKLLELNRNISAVDTYKFLILSTSKGILTTREAIALNCGGEILAVVN